LYWDEAVRKLLTLRKQRVLTPSLQATLARLYDQVGDWDACRRELYDLGGREGRNPGILSMIIDKFIAHGEFSNAEPWLRKLEQVAPRSPETLRRRARYLAKVGENEKAKALLLAMVPKKPGEKEAALPPEQVNLVLLLAMEFESLGELDTAEELYRRYVSLRPIHRLQLAHFLVRHSDPAKVAEGIQYCDDNLKGVGLDDVLQTGSLAVRNSKDKITPEQMETMERWYRLAQNEHPDSVTVRMRLAEFRDLQGRTDDAFKVYEGILQDLKLPGQQRTFVLNNLAFLMAMGNGDMDVALKYINEAIELLGPRDDLLDTRGMIYWRRGEYDAAVRELEKAVAGNKSWVKTFHLAVGKAASGDWAGAEKLMRQVQEMKPDLNELTPLERKLYAKLVEDLKERAKK
jgi:tetratricopeptide (TPR) repeat protein